MVEQEGSPKKCKRTSTYFLAFCPADEIELEDEKEEATSTKVLRQEYKLNIITSHAENLFQQTKYFKTNSKCGQCVLV